MRRLAADEMRRRVKWAAGLLGLAELLDRLPQAALRRPAPARRHGARAGARADGVPARRAAVEPRRQAARRGARGDRRAAAPHRDDDALRHARSGRGDDARRPRHRARPRARAAGRDAARALRAAGERLRRRLHRQSADEPVPAARLDGGRAKRGSSSPGRPSPAAWTARWPRRSAQLAGRRLTGGVRPEALRLGAAPARHRSACSSSTRRLSATRRSSPCDRRRPGARRMPPV